MLMLASVASLTWAFDEAAAATRIALLVLPLMLLYVVTRTWLAGGVSARPAGYALLTSASVAALVGLYQAATTTVWWNPKVIDANRFRPDVRTNSILWDPNMYGRVLVIAIVLVVAWLLITRAPSRRSWLTMSAVGVLLLVALWHTWSQSSWLALAAAAAFIGLLTLPPQLRRFASAAVVIVVLVGTPLALRTLAGDDTEGRASVVRTGVALAAEQPVHGWGVASFEAAAKARAEERGAAEPRLTSSHTSPVTVAAELGIIGSAGLLTLLIGAFAAVLARWRETSTPASAARAKARARGERVEPLPTGWPSAAIVWATGAIAALVAHSMVYAGLLEDPTTWAVLAVLASMGHASTRAYGSVANHDDDSRSILRQPELAPGRV
jgi:hypothetical protein